MEFAPFERTRGTFTITSDPRRIDVDAVRAFLARSYWAESIPRSVVERSIARSLCFSLLDGDRQAGFARAVTDGATFAYLCDVYVLEEYRGRGLGKWLVAELMTHPDLQGVRRFVLVTQDAHSLYAANGFSPLAKPGGYMEIVRSGVYAGGRDPGAR